MQNLTKLSISRNLVLKIIGFVFAVGLFGLGIVLWLEVAGLRHQVFLPKLLPFFVTYPDARQRAASFKTVVASKIGKETLEDYLLLRTHILVTTPVGATDGLHDWHSIQSQFKSCSSAATITGDGYLLTAQHCVEGERDLFVVLAGNPDVATNKPYNIIQPARIVWASPRADLALLHASGLPKKHFRIGDPRAIKAGDRLATAGVYFPFEASGACQVKVDCASGKCVKVKSTSESPLVTRLISDLPQRPGESGGPTITLDGNLVGIHTSASGCPRMLMRMVLPEQEGMSVSTGVDPEYLNQLIFDDRKHCSTTKP